MEIVDRIKVVMRMNNLSAASFADEIGVQRANVSHVLTGRNKPSLDFIERILKRFERVNAGWLISGKVSENSLVNHHETERKMSNQNQSSNTDYLTSNFLNSDKTIHKIIVFYEDNTFDSYSPNNSKN